MPKIAHDGLYYHPDAYMSMALRKTCAKMTTTTLPTWNVGGSRYAESSTRSLSSLELRRSRWVVVETVGLAQGLGRSDNIRMRREVGTHVLHTEGPLGWPN